MKAAWAEGEKEGERCDTLIRAQNQMHLVLSWRTEHHGNSRPLSRARRPTAMQTRWWHGLCSGVTQHARCITKGGSHLHGTNLSKKKRPDDTFWRQGIEEPSVIPGFPDTCYRLSLLPEHSE